MAEPGNRLATAFAAATVIVSITNGRLDARGGGNVVPAVILAGVLVSATLLLLLRSHPALVRRRQRPAPIAATLAEPAPATPGASVAAGAPGAAPSPRRRHDNRGLTHFAGPGTNAARRTTRVHR
jgi:hypothetical protein